MKTLQLSVLMAVLGLFAISCNSLSQEEKKIVGKFYMAESEETEADDENPAMVISIEGTQEYRKDKTTSMDLTLKMLVEIMDYDYFNIITVEYRIQAEGTWSLAGNALTERYNPQSIKLDFVGSKATDKDEMAQYSIKMIKQYADAYLTETKRDLVNTTYTITSQTDWEMILEDEDGSEITYTRIKNDKKP